MEKKTGTDLEKETVRDVICRITKSHLLNGGMIMGQCLTTDGRVRGTIPQMENERGIVELPMADVAGGSFAVGVALAGRRPIYVVRFQGFQWYNAVEIVNYAAKSKEMWGIPCPLFIRSVGLDGGGGPVAGNAHHGLYYRMPGIDIVAPSTPKEYESAWNHFITHDKPMYVSENRKIWDVTEGLEPLVEAKADITLFPISSTRLHAREARTKLNEEGVNANIVDLFWLKPFEATELMKDSLARSKYGGLVIDGDYENAASKCIAYELMHATDKPVYAIGLEERTAGFAPSLDNVAPTSERIYSKVFEIIKNYNTTKFLNR